jgi:hypothetical protein
MIKWDGIMIDDEVFDLYRKEILADLNDRNPSMGMNIIPQTKSIPYGTSHVPIKKHEINFKLNYQDLDGKKDGTYQMRRLCLSAYGWSRNL